MQKYLSKCQKGQAVVEYVVICLVLVAALLAPIPGTSKSAIQLLVDTIKAEYAAYKYAHSVGSLP